MRPSWLTWLGYQEFRDGAADQPGRRHQVDDMHRADRAERPARRCGSSCSAHLHQHSARAHPGQRCARTNCSSTPYWTAESRRHRPLQVVEVCARPVHRRRRQRDYFLGKPKAERIIYQIYADIPSIMNALEAGELDVMSYEGGGVPVERIERIEAMEHLTVLPDMDAGLPTYLSSTTTMEWLQDANVRRSHGATRSTARRSSTPYARLGHRITLNTMFPAEWAHPEGMNPNAYDPANSPANCWPTLAGIRAARSTSSTTMPTRSTRTR
jgi:hypothetical protein